MVKDLVAPDPHISCRLTKYTEIARLCIQCGSLPLPLKVKGSTWTNNRSLSPRLLDRRGHRHGRIIGEGLGERFLNNKSDLDDLLEVHPGSEDRR